MKPSPVRRKAVLVDVDGTLCDVKSIRHHVRGQRKNFDRFHEESLYCPPNQEVLRWCEKMWDANHSLVVVTARMEKWRELTKLWLRNNMTRPFEALFMREDGDFRPDYVVKREIYNRLSMHYDIRHACDDNPNVIKLWNELKIPTKIVTGGTIKNFSRLF